jgi:hypothetical protein
MVSTRGRTRSTCLSRRAGGNVPSKRWRRFAYGALGLALALGVAFAIAGALTPRARAVEIPPPDFTIAFIGDQGLGPDAEAVLQLIADEGADAVLHSGDFDYADDPAAWDDQIDRVLGPDFPYFASVGNHDTADFYTSGGYQDRLAARMNRLGIPWEGDLGVQSSFSYQGVFFVLTAPAVFGAGDGFHDLYIRDRLAASDAAWRISSWHKNMRLMQVGGKPDSTGWGVYEESRRGGAIIATGHEHSYSRTHLLSSMETQAIASTDDTLVLSRDDPATPGVDEGRSFAFVSGLGGQTIRNQDLDGPWWASIRLRRPVRRVQLPGRSGSRILLLQGRLWRRRGRVLRRERGGQGAAAARDRRRFGGRGRCGHRRGGVHADAALRERSGRERRLCDRGRQRGRRRGLRAGLGSAGLQWRCDDAADPRRGER